MHDMPSFFFFPINHFLINRICRVAKPPHPLRAPMAAPQVAQDGDEFLFQKLLRTGHKTDPHEENLIIEISYLNRIQLHLEPAFSDDST
jgi:hypothetical protein